MNLKKKQSEYWSQVFIALSQVTFGVAWASLFLPLDVYKVTVIILNITITALLIFAGWLLRRLK